MWMLLLVSITTGFVLGVSAHLSYLLMRAAATPPPQATT